MIAKNMAHQHLDEYCKCMKQIYESKLSSDSSLEEIIQILMNEYYENQELFEKFCLVNADLIDKSSLFYIVEDFYGRNSLNFKALNNVSLEMLYELTQKELVIDVSSNRIIDSNTNLDFKHLFNEIIYSKKMNTETLAKKMENDICVDKVVGIRSGNINISLDELLFISFSLDFTLDEYNLLANFFNGDKERKSSFAACIASRMYIRRWENNEALPDREIINLFLANRGQEPLKLKFEEIKKENKERNLLVVGAAGFIGENASKYFEGSFDKVVNLFHSHRRSFGNVQYYGDCKDEHLMEEIILTENITHVLFLAGYSLVGEAERNRCEALTYGSSLVVPMLERIVKNNLNDKVTVLVPSTVQVYEASYKGSWKKKDGELLCDENITLPSCFLTNTYALSKMNIESNIWRYIKLNCRIGIPRLANVYGENDTHPRLIPSVAMYLKEHKSPKIMYDANSKKTQKLNYIHITDCVKAFLMIFDYYDGLDKLSAQDVIFNIAGDKSYRTEDVIVMLRDLIDKDASIEVGYGSYDTRDLVISNEKLKKLGFNVEIPLEEGLRRVASAIDDTYVRKVGK